MCIGREVAPRAQTEANECRAAGCEDRIGWHREAKLRIGQTDVGWHDGSPACSIEVARGYAFSGVRYVAVTVEVHPHLQHCRAGIHVHCCHLDAGCGARDHRSSEHHAIFVVACWRRGAKSDEACVGVIAAAHETRHIFRRAIQFDVHARTQLEVGRYDVLGHIRSRSSIAVRQVAVVITDYLYQIVFYLTRLSGAGRRHRLICVGCQTDTQAQILADHGIAGYVYEDRNHAQGWIIRNIDVEALTPSKCTVVVEVHEYRHFSSSAGHVHHRNVQRGGLADNEQRQVGIVNAVFVISTYRGCTSGAKACREIITTCCLASVCLWIAVRLCINTSTDF